MEVGIKKAELDYIWKTKKVYLIYNDEKNKAKTNIHKIGRLRELFHKP